MDGLKLLAGTRDTRRAGPQTLGPSAFSSQPCSIPYLKGLVLKYVYSLTFIHSILQISAPGPPIRKVELRTSPGKTWEWAWNHLDGEFQRPRAWCLVRKGGHGFQVDMASWPHRRPYPFGKGHGWRSAEAPKHRPSREPLCVA